MDAREQTPVPAPKRGLAATWRALSPSQRYLALSVLELALLPLAVVVHNGLSALLGLDEPVFFVLAVLGAPVLILAGLIGAAEAAAEEAPRRRGTGRGERAAHHRA